jgi:DNA repair protein RadC
MNLNYCIRCLCVYNHPSCDVSASKQDIGLTKTLTEAEQIIGIDVLDHTIVEDNKHLSMKAKGLFYLLLQQ